MKHRLQNRACNRTLHARRPATSTDHSLKLSRYTDATLLQTFTGIEGTSRSITFSPNGKLLATYGRDRAVRVFEVKHQNN